MKRTPPVLRPSHPNRIPPPPQDLDKTPPEGAVKPKSCGRTTPAVKKRSKEASALALPPPATEKCSIGFIPEEFCAPFRLLFQLFAVAGWP